MNKNIVLLFLPIIILFAFPAWARPTPEEEETEIATEEPMMAEGKYNEAPMLAELVAKGELPPVDERLPKSPKVVEIIESIGRYGDDLIVFATGENVFNQDLQGMWGTSFFRNPRTGVDIEMDVAKGYEVNADKTAVTIFLREGMKWSDGAPFTSEDVRFAFDDMHFNEQVSTWGAYGLDEVEVIDEYAVKLTNREGLGTNLLQMSTWFGGYATSFHPAHYLKKWHADYSPDAQKIAEEEGFENWYDAMNSHYWWAPLKDPDKPQVEPWQLVEFGITAKLFERNPYFHRVDPEGNQLPYVDRLRVQIVDPEVYQLKVTGGEASIAYYNTQFDNIPLYKTNEESGDYRVILHPGVMGSNMKIIVNQNHPDPELRAVYNNIKFKQGLSVAINREEVNEVIYQGLGVPGQLAPLESVSFYKDGWRQHYAQYDPGLANRLLDEAGLNKKDKNGWRLMPTGKPLSLVVEFTAAQFSSELELVKEYWEDVGVKTTIKLEDMGLLDQRVKASEYFAWVHPNPSQPWCSERQMFQASWVWAGEAGQAAQWQSWLSAKSDLVREELGEGVPFPDDWRRRSVVGENEIEFEKPPAIWIEMAELENAWTKMEMGSSEYRETGQRYFDFFVTDLTRIGVVGEIPSIMLAKNKLGNVLTPGWVAGAPIDHEYVQTWMDQLYWKE